MSDEEIIRLQNTIQNSKRVHEEDSKWLALLSKVIPDFDKHEKRALNMVNEYGIIGALRAARNNIVKENFAMNNKMEPPCNCAECAANLEAGCAFDDTPENCEGIVIRRKIQTVARSHSAELIYAMFQAIMTRPHIEKFLTEEIRNSLPCREFPSIEEVMKQCLKYDPGESPIEYSLDYIAIERVYNFMVKNFGR